MWGEIVVVGVVGTVAFLVWTVVGDILDHRARERWERSIWGDFRAGPEIVGATWDTTEQKFTEVVVRSTNGQSTFGGKFAQMAIDRHGLPPALQRLQADRQGRQLGRSRYQA